MTTASPVKIYSRLLGSNALLRNAVFIAVSTGIMSVLGFGFWAFVAHLYSPSDIGVASSVISISLLISNLSMLGLNVGLVRFLPKSRTPSGHINAALTVTGLTAVAASAVYVLSNGTIHEKLAFFSQNPATILLFCLLLAAVALNSLTDSIFVAYRRAEFHTLTYAAFGLVRLVLPLLLVPYGALGVFTAYAVAGVVSLALSLFFMNRYCDYRPFTRPEFGLLSQTRRLATNNYVGMLLAGLPPQLLPTFIIATMGERPSGFFAMVWTMANLLYIVPNAISQSLLAETSHNPAQVRHDVTRAAKLLTVIILPLTVLSIFLAPLALQIFGPDYVKNGQHPFQIMALGTIFLSVTAISKTVLNFQHRSGWSAVIQLLATTATFACFGVFIPLGLIGVSLSLVIGNAVEAASHLAVHWLTTRRHATA